MILYCLFLFAVGFGHHIEAPLIPLVGSIFGVYEISAILMISVYGYATTILALLSG